ncbi:glycosyltransferase family 2 protein [Gordonia crocea]|uniref:glycosyltransferase family 2 protein n=1 Tax=Gordonia crocea TaxID=589162 RepID=UPI001E3F3219|nr:glycosyltransferase [Gordonia crocea]
MICCHDSRRWEAIQRCLAAVTAQRREGDEVIVVVDRNPDLYARLKSASGGVRVVLGGDTGGLSAARNTGLQNAASTIVAFVDDDAVPAGGWLDAIAKSFADPQVMMVGGEIFPQWPGGSRPTWLPLPFDWVVGCDYQGMPPVGAPVRNPIGANMAVRRDLAIAAGGFHTGLGRAGENAAGAEETDLAIRMRQIWPAKEIMRIGGASVRHSISPLRCSRRYFIRRCIAEGRSKAMLGHRGGYRDSLSAERRYLRSALPRAVAADVVGLRRGDLNGLQRAIATIIGTGAAGLGWLTGLVSRPRGTDGAWGIGAEPTCVVDVDGSSGVPVRPIPELGHRAVDAVHLRVRLDGRQIASIRVPIGPAIPASTQIRTAVDGAVAGVGRRAYPTWPAVDQTVTAALCTLGRSPRLAATVQAILAEQTLVPAEVVVIDNDPRSGATRAALTAVADNPRLRIVEEPRRGLSCARNTALAAARGDIVVFTDDDAEPEPDWLERLAAVFAADTDGDVTCVTGAVIPAELGRAIFRWFERAARFDRGLDPMVWHPGVSRSLDWLRRWEPTAKEGARGLAYPIAGSEFGSGNNMAFRRARIIELGGFDELLGAGTSTRGGEDLDAFRRVNLAGDAIVYQPAAIVRHHHRDNRAALRRQLYGYGTGMSASVCRHLVRGPNEAVGVAQALPGGLRLLFDPRSPKNAAKREGYPLALGVVEIVGYAAGPAHLTLSALRRATRQRAATTRHIGSERELPVSMDVQVAASVAEAGNAGSAVR